MSSPSGCPVGCLLLLLVRPYPPPGSLLIAWSRLRMLVVLSVWLSCRLLAAVACSSTSAAWFSCDRLVFLANSGCPLRLAVLSAACCCCLFVYIRRVRWCCCPPGSLLIACSRLPTLVVLSVFPVGCLLLLPAAVTCSSTSAAWLSTDRHPALASESKRSVENWTGIRTNGHDGC